MVLRGLRGGKMKVKCRNCGAINEKERTEYSVKCPKCGTVTSYWIHPQVKEET